jgi:ferredoxin-NADP reductase
VIEVATNTTWGTAIVREMVHQNPMLAMLRLELPGRPRHVPGQHYIVRLTAEDGYTASRSYSIASSPDDELLELAIERLEDGEVSTYLADIAMPGDELEVRGPIGGYFIWDATTPAVCVGGGTGVVPFVSMVRYAREQGQLGLLRLAVSARTLADLPYAEEVSAVAAVVAITREATTAGARPTGRLTAADLEPLVTPGATYFVCGSAIFAEAATQLLLVLGVGPAEIKVERFGPSG